MEQNGIWFSPSFTNYPEWEREKKKPMGKESPLPGLAPKEGLILRLFQKNKEKILARLRLFMGTLVVPFEFSPPEIEAANWNYVRRLPEFLFSLESAHYFPSSSLFLSLTKMKSLLSTEGHQPIINQILNILVHTEENGDKSVFFPP